jgi:hypothetical protein
MSNKKYFKEYVHKFGYHQAKKILGLSYTEIAELTGEKINEEIAYEILYENIKNKLLPTEYKGFTIEVNFDGLVYWETKTQTGKFPSNFIEHILVYATPFYDGSVFTPVEIDFYELTDENDVTYVKLYGDGDFYKTFLDEYIFHNIEDLIVWYKDVYLPKTFNLIMTLISEVHNHIENKGFFESLREHPINENFGEKIITTIQNSINKNGLVTTIKIFGYKTILSKLLELNIETKDKINFISYVLKNVRGFSLTDVGNEPIPYKKKGDEYHEIVYLSTNFVYIDVWVNGIYDGEYDVHYHNLTDDMINEIFWIVKSVALENEVFN